MSFHSRPLARIALALSVLSLLPVASAARAATDADLQRALEEISALKERVEQLERDRDDQRRAAVAAPRHDPAPAPEPESLLTKLGSTIDLYGFLRLDVVYDDSLPNDPQVIGYIRSEDPRSGNPSGKDDFTLYPRLTRFGLNLHAPKIPRLGPFDLTGKLEIDFYGSPASDSRNQIRMRHAYLKLASHDWSILAGQTTDVISPIYPAVNADLVMWGAGNLGDRRPQLRVSYEPKLLGGQLKFQSEVGLTGADAGEDLDSNGFLDGEYSGRPTVQTRIAYRGTTPLSAQPFEIGAWYHHAWEEIDAPINGRSHFQSQAAGGDLTLPFYGDVAWLKSEMWAGKNLDDVRGGIFQGVNTTTGREISSWGGFVEVGVEPVEWNTLSLGFSWDDPDNGDLTDGNPSDNRARNQIVYLSNVLHYFDPLTIGFEYLRWTTHYVGLGQGDDNRFKAYISYGF